MQRQTVHALVVAGVIFAATTAGTVVLGGQALEADTPIVPVYHEPHHRQVFQYGPTRILDLQIPPGDRSWFHSHVSPVLYVTLSTSQTRMQTLGQDWNSPAAPTAAGRGARAGGGGAAGGRSAGRGVGGGTPAGPVTPRAPRATSTTSYAEQPLTHRLENIGAGLFRAMVVINETPGDETTSVEAAGFSGEPELTNRWFRAYRVVLEPGATSPQHLHRASVAIIQATDGHGRGDGGRAWEFNEPGQWAFFDAGTRHELRNVGDRRLELIEVELRGK